MRYEYTCPECNNKEEKRLSVEDRDRLAPVCCGQRMKRKLQPVPFTMK